MQYTRLGNTGLIVSKFALGCMTFGSGEGALGSVYKVNQETANKLVERALEAGVNFFNTADAYADGQSEVMLGKALGKRRQDVVIATKVGNRMSEALIDQGLSRQHILASVQGSLKRLNTDYIDVYLVHRLDPYTPLEETLEALDTVVKQGMVRYIGFSNWPAWLAARAVGLQHEHHWAQFRAAEMYYSLVGRDLEHEIVPFVEDAGIGIMVWSPLASGFLSGKYTRENPGGNGGRLTGFDIIPFDRERGYDVVERLREIGGQHNASPAQVALAWLLSRPSVTSILIGASKMSQLQDNLGAASLSLSVDELAELDKLTEPRAIYPNWFNATIYDAQARAALNTR
ncbi:aldo/keto reductase [Ktedonosporobacter rubrisoli]|uniref:Aldo/keto reductase n=1 Tax=Ktedonosporobacter rubrisoli TaxID=2509675 RepID=A0A4P6JX30_KTERU|nr:aldo/keto reductase [Ktedonosporobacter rubrisoli]QBD80298.1 aldo/keto reductase [Ktedonosporobacter rubrisoli]